MTTRTPRGIRNHNPGNIERTKPATPWQGIASEQTDDRFVVFKAPEWGIRAIARILISYQDKHGLNSVRRIINRWAPPVENDTASYVLSVAKRLNVNPDQSISVYEYDTMRTLVEAIIRHENGVQPYDEALIKKGLVLAGIEAPIKPIEESRTIKGGQVAAASTSAAVVVEAVEGARSLVEPLVPYLEVAKYVLLVITLVSVGYMMYCRYQDQKRRIV